MARLRDRYPAFVNAREAAPHNRRLNPLSLAMQAWFGASIVSVYARIRAGSG